MVLSSFSRRWCRPVLSRDVVSRPFQVNEWLLYDMPSPSDPGARGGAILGLIYRAAGVLVASVAQEGLVRVEPLANPV